MGIKAIQESGSSTPKTFANSFLYKRVPNYERNLMEYVMQAQRLDKKSEAFFSIIEDVKRRQSSAVLSRVLAREDLIISSYEKPLPASFKVFACKDVKAGGGVKVFIDVSGLIVEKNGFYICNKIDVLCSHLMSAMTMLVYANQTMKITGNSTITQSGTQCFVSLASHIFDYLRLNGYAENKNKISYILAMYYQVNMLGFDREDQSTKNLAVKVSGLQLKDINAMEIYYEDEDLTNIDTLLKSITETFKMRGMTTDIFIEKWSWFFGTGTHFGCELFTAFAKMITDAYCGSYINNQKSIEKCCGRTMVEFSTALLRVGEDVIDNGFRYESSIDRECFGMKGNDIITEGLFGPKVKISNEDKLTVEDIRNSNPSIIATKAKKQTKLMKDGGCSTKEISKNCKQLWLAVVGSVDINNYNNALSTVVGAIHKNLETKEKDYIIHALVQTIVNFNKALADEKNSGDPKMQKKILADDKKALKILDSKNAMLKESSFHEAVKEDILNEISFKKRIKVPSYMYVEEYDFDNINDVKKKVKELVKYIKKNGGNDDDVSSHCKVMLIKTLLRCTRQDNIIRLYNTKYHMTKLTKEVKDYLTPKDSSYIQTQYQSIVSNSFIYSANFRNDCREALKVMGITDKNNAFVKAGDIQDKIFFRKPSVQYNESSIEEALLPRLHKPKEEPVEDIDTEIADGKEIIKYRIKEIVQRYNKTADIRKKMRKDMDKYININPGNLDKWENTRNVPKLTYGVYEEDELSISFLIVDGTSFLRESLDGIVKDIRSDLMKCKDIKSLPALANTTTGDYGSGIIYITFKK